MNKNYKTLLATVIYISVIIGANWMIENVGQDHHGTHFLPVGFGLIAPSGVYLAGIAFVARDYMQRFGGWKIGVASIIIGAAISWAVSSPQIAIASGVTFLLSESTDFAVFTPLQQFNLSLSILASGLSAVVVDSIVFLWLAGIPFQIALEGQLLGKFWMVLLGTIVTIWIRKQHNKERK